MKRHDLRHLKADFYDRMMEVINNELQVEEVGIFLFEVGDFSPIQKSADLIKRNGHELLNSLKFNEVDWTIVVRKKESVIEVTPELKNADEEESATPEPETSKAQESSKEEAKS